MTGCRLDGYRRAVPVARDALACVALPTCPLAMAEAERYLPAVTGRLDELMRRHGLAGEPLLFRISGCPNGCSRPTLAEVALIGKAPGRYSLFIGGARNGERLNRPYRENVDEEGFLAALDPLFAAWARERQAGEAFGDFVLRAGLAGEPTAPVAGVRDGGADASRAAGVVEAGTRGVE